MWNRPKFIEESIIDASRVAHPLLQMSTEKFVTNPVSSGGNYSKIKVGLLVYLAHIGSFVPAEVAHMGTVDRIISRIYTTDSVLDGMSTFAKDLDQISISLRRGNERSLIIIDEFGKGTLTEVGLSLLASSLSYWAAKGQSGCPHIFIASHFHALSKLISDHCDILSYHTLEVLRRGAELDFQFRLVEGMVDSSFAAYVAAKMGVPTGVVDRANEVYEHIRSGRTVSEITVDYEGEQENRWLYQQFKGIWNEFETWDLDNDPHGLLALVEKTLFESSCSDEFISDSARAQEKKDQSQKSDDRAVEDISSLTGHRDDHLSSQQHPCIDRNRLREELLLVDFIARKNMLCAADVFLSSLFSVNLLLLLLLVLCVGSYRCKATSLISCEVSVGPYDLASYSDVMMMMAHYAFIHGRPRQLTLG
uniref:DNA_MISMATCH_REPAIR_2 domain-containing protein n=1 Tax=Angiostrongylus cantonensis TaxID=6313 RepID=A0A0K0DGW0_ANGCA